MGRCRYELAIFDLDGTILDTLVDLSNSLNYALASCGFPVRTLEEARRFVGNGIRNLIERGVPQGTSEAEVDRVFDVFRMHYREHGMDATRPYEGIPALLSRLRADGVRLAVVSNKADDAVRALCDAYFPETFDLAVGEREGIARKPAPDSVNEVLRQLCVRREDAVYVGDSEVDIQTAQNASMDAWIVTWGFRDAEYLMAQGARQLADTPTMLYEALATDTDS